ncbi:hypothetical protein [Thermaerobacter litoralis]
MSEDRAERIGWLIVLLLFGGLILAAYRADCNAAREELGRMLNDLEDTYIEYEVADDPQLKWAYRILYEDKKRRYEAPREAYRQYLRERCNKLWGWP